MRAVVVTSYDDDTLELETIDNIYGWDLTAYAAAQVRQHGGHCCVYLVVNGRLYLAAEEERH